MVEVKILNDSHGEKSFLANLTESLQNLLSAAAKSEWDKAGDFADALLPALQTLCQPAFLASETSRDPESIRRVLALLQSALVQCTNRKMQIEPLINALIHTKDISDTA